MAAGAEGIAATSPALFAQLLEAIAPTSPAYSRALEQGIKEIAKSRGLEAAAPFLRQLSQAPTTEEDDSGNRVVTNGMTPRATREAIEAGGALSPALALQLARGLGADDNNLDDEGARALAEAAFFQPPDVAAGLWKEALPRLNADRAMQIAARVAKSQPALGAELAGLARQQLETSDEIDSWGNSIAVGFAFYEAQLDAARARYRLEQEWWKLQGQTDEYRAKPNLVRAMSSIDGERAFEWASLLATEGEGEGKEERIRALGQAARYIAANAQARAGVDFQEWGHNSTIFDN